MIEGLILLAGDPVAATNGNTAVFACAFMATANDDWDNPYVDLRAERQSDSTGEHWQLDWADGRSARAEAFDADFGSVGGSTGIRWADGNGPTQRAFISYSDMALPGGQEAMFLSLDEPSLWQPPGYICQTAALEENRQ